MFPVSLAIALYIVIISDIRCWEMEPTVHFRQLPFQLIITIITDRGGGMGAEEMVG